MSVVDAIRRFFRAEEQRGLSIYDLDRGMDAFFIRPPTWSNERVDTREAQDLATVYRCISLIAEVASTLPLHIYRRGEDDSRSIARGNYLYPIVHTIANPYSPSHMFRESMLRDAIGWGNGFAVKEYDRSQRVKALWRLSPDRCTPCWEEDTRTAFVRYHPRVGPHVDFLMSQLFHVPGPTVDGIFGYSVIKLHARNGIGAALSAKKFGSRFFANNARPSGVLSAPAKLTPGARENIIAGWEKMTGNANQLKTALLEEGVTYTQVTINPDDAQFLETMDYNDHDVCKWFGVPPVLAGVVSKTTSWGTGIEQLNIGFLQYTLQKWLERYEGAIQKDLIGSPSDLYAEHDVAGLLRGDLAAQAEHLVKLTGGGIMQYGEARSKLNLNPDDAGRMYARTANATFITPDGQPVEALQPPEPQPAQPSKDKPNGTN